MRSSITRGEQDVLDELVDADEPLTSREISRRVDISLAPINKRLRNLVAYGLLIRYRPAGQNSYLYAHKENREARRKLGRIAGREWE